MADNRGKLKKLLSVTALAALMGLVLPAAWAENAPLQLEGDDPELIGINLADRKREAEPASPEVSLGVSGGGEFFRGGYDSFTIIGGKVISNLASARKGAFAHGGGLAIANINRVDLSGLAFNHNMAMVDGTGNTTAVAGHGPSAGARGGALSIYNQGRVDPVFVPSKLMVFRLSDSNFSGNTAEASGEDTLAAGGAVAVLGHIDAVFNDSTSLGRIRFESNLAVAGPESNGGAEGGAVMVTGNPFRELAGDLPPTAVFSNVLFDGNRAESQLVKNEHMDARGGAVSLQALGGKVFFQDCVFSENQLETVVAESSKGRGRARGGAIYSENGLTIKDSLFQNNRGYSPGGALGGALEVGGVKSVIKKSLFESNTAQGGLKSLGRKYNGPVGGFGGALYLNGQMTITDSTFSKNIAQGLSAEGGAVFVGPKGVLTLVDTSFTDNMALGPKASGGAIDVAAGGQLIVGVSRGRTVTWAGNKAGSGPENFRSSGIFLATPEEPARLSPPPPAEERPPKSEFDDLIINTAEKSQLILRDPVQGEKAKITKNGPGRLALAGENLAEIWKIQAGSLSLITDEEGRGGRLKAGRELSFAANTTLILELPLIGGPHTLETADLKLPPGFTIMMSEEGGQVPKPGTVLKLTGWAGAKSLAGLKYSGTMLVSGIEYDYRLEWNNKGELVLNPAKNP